MQDPFKGLNKIESEMNRAAGQARNPGQAARQKADMIQRQINQGTANIIGALCYATGIVALIAGSRKQWREDQTIRYHAAHARFMWMVMIICACTVIGLLVAVPMYMGMLYLASEAVAGRRPTVPFITQFIQQRGWM